MSQESKPMQQKFVKFAEDTPEGAKLYVEKFIDAIKAKNVKGIFWNTLSSIRRYKSIYDDTEFNIEVQGPYVRFRPNTVAGHAYGFIYVLQGLNSIFLDMRSKDNDTPMYHLYSAFQIYRMDGDNPSKYKYSKEAIWYSDHIVYSEGIYYPKTTDDGARAFDELVKRMKLSEDALEMMFSILHNFASDYDDYYNEFVKITGLKNEPVESSEFPKLLF